MAMTHNLSLDSQKRISLGKLGFDSTHAVATPLEDGSGWIIRPGNVYTEAELDILGNPETVASLRRSLDDIDDRRSAQLVRRG
jgi:hypothetical protein